ncbi:MAG: MMPL family transporter [Chloroflexota bacterium]|nr:MMPL family transporter [Chloroflexota bacterium]
MLSTSSQSVLASRTSDFILRHSGWFIGTVLALTVLFALPIVFMAPPGPASQDPGGPVFDLLETVNQRFPPRIHVTTFIVEDPQGDILRQQPLWELYQNERKLRASDLGSLLYSGYDADRERQILGIYTIADAVQNLFLLDPSTATSLKTATDDQVKAAISRILDSPTGRPLRGSLSKDASFQTKIVDGQEINSWSSAAFSAFVASDNEMLGGGPLTISLTGDDVTLGKERFNRRVREILQTEQSSYQLWGVALDVNLVSQEQGKTAIPFIAATVVLVLVVVGVTLRSLGIAGLAFLGLLMLFVWLKGLTILVGLGSSLILDLIVPIAMISLGVDFLIHAVARYREETRRVAEPSLALRAGFTGVIGALTLAMLSDGIAFLANLTSGIETVIGFGIGAGIAVLSSYVIMGMFLPLVIMRLDQRRLESSPQHGRAFGDAQEPVSAGSTSAPPTGLASAAIAGAVLEMARHRWTVLPIAAVLTAAATLLAFQLEPNLDVKDFFDSESDLVIGLDKLDQHTAAALSGEPAVIYIRGDLTTPESLAAIRDLLDRLSENSRLGQAEDGQVSLYARTLFQLLSRVTENPYARSQVLAKSRVDITDENGDQIPDSPGQVQAAFDYMVRHGVPLNESTMVYDSIQVRETLHYDPSQSGEQEIILVVGVLGSRQQANIGSARQALEQDLDPMRQVPSISFVGLTGSPFTREATLQATTRALNVSLPVAVAACLILLAFWMRSVTLAVVTIIPIGLVVSWLYAFMYIAGYSLNFVTATIAAVSIGVGIDYSIHMTQRFREELGREQGAEEALRAAASGTGVALAGSAGSSVIGFAVMALAPMPLFSAYGVITAAMIFMAAAAALFVLPSLLLLTHRVPKRSS